MKFKSNIPGGFAFRVNDKCKLTFDTEKPTEVKDKAQQELCMAYVGRQLIEVSDEPAKPASK